jgi:hypothetical protein
VEDRKIKTSVATHKSQQSKISQIKYINEIVKFILQVTTDAAESYMEVKIASVCSLITFQMLQHKFHAYVIDGSWEKQIFRLIEVLPKTNFRKIIRNDHLNTIWRMACVLTRIVFNGATDKSLISY